MTHSTFQATKPTFQEYKTKNYGAVVDKYFAEFPEDDGVLEDIAREMYYEFISNYTSEDD